VPQPSTSTNTKLGLCGKERFTYAPDKDGYRCPWGEARTFRCETTELGRHIHYAATGACQRCPLKEPCTSNNDGRRMPRGVDAHVLERMEERLTAPPEILQERKQLVEHPCGPIKHTNDQGSCLMKGLTNVRAEFSLSCLADNLTRVINHLSVPQRLVALGEGRQLLYVCPRSSTGRRPCRRADRESSHEHALPAPTAPQVSVSFHTA
jgi:hypothetical protein